MPAAFIFDPNNDDCIMMIAIIMIITTTAAAAVKLTFYHHTGIFLSFLYVFTSILEALSCRQFTETD